jgi:hypothetical protein
LCTNSRYISYNNIGKVIITTTPPVNINQISNKSLSGGSPKTPRPRQSLKNQQSRIIRCYSIKNVEQQDSILDKSAEMMLKRDLLEDKIGLSKTTKPSMQSGELLVVNDELDDESIAEIKNALCNHYLLTDLSIQIM